MQLLQKVFWQVSERCLLNLQIIFEAVVCGGVVLDCKILSVIFVLPEESCLRTLYPALIKQAWEGQHNKHLTMYCDLI